jgi:predicted nuclease of predicted toxin-antitoxin system
MKIMADESVDFPIIRKLRENNFDVVAVVEVCPSVSDEEVLNLANQLQGIILTADKDFGELSFRFKKVSYGIVLLRFAGITNPEKAALTLNVVKTYGSELYNKFCVVSKDAIRIRSL